MLYIEIKIVSIIMTRLYCIVLGREALLLLWFFFFNQSYMYLFYCIYEMMYIYEEL